MAHPLSLYTPAPPLFLSFFNFISTSNTVPPLSGSHFHFRSLSSHPTAAAGEFIPTACRWQIHQWPQPQSTRLSRQHLAPFHGSTFHRPRHPTRRSINRRSASPICACVSATTLSRTTVHGHLPIAIHRSLLRHLAEPTANIIFAFNCSHHHRRPPWVLSFSFIFFGYFTSVSL